MTKLKVTAVSSIILYQPVLMLDFGPTLSLRSGLLLRTLRVYSFLFTLGWIPPTIRVTLMWEGGSIRGVHGSGLGNFFTQPTMVDKKKIQPNPTHYISPTWPDPTHMGRVEPMDLTNFIIIIIKLSKKNININILKKPKD